MANLDLLFKSFEQSSSFNLNVCGFGKIESWDSFKNTCTVTPLFKPKGMDPFPTLVNVSVLFPSFGGYTFKFPMVAGSIVMLFFLDYDSDMLMQDGVTIESNTDRMHSINDAVAIPLSFNPVQNDFKGDNNCTIQKDNTETKFVIKEDGSIEINATHVKIGGDSATHGVALGDLIKQVFDNHSHGTNGKPTTQFPSPSSKLFTL